MKKFLFTTYKGQPQMIQIDSDYAFILSNWKNKEIINYRVLEIAKTNEFAIRILPDTQSIGRWYEILSISLSGIEYRSIHINTKEHMIEINRTDDENHQLIKEYPSN